jgi:two-component system, NtrC family, response regulator AtoC
LKQVDSDKPTRMVLIFEEESEARCRLETSVKTLGHSVLATHDLADLLTWLRDPEIHTTAVFLAFATAHQDDLNSLKQIRLVGPHIPIVILAGVWSTRDVVVGLRSGATDFLFQPVIQEELSAVLASAMEKSNGSRAALRKVRPLSTFRSANPRIREIESVIERIGWSDAPVLIQGETGSGKEVLARALHKDSARAGKPFLKLNCAALPSELVESELFGYERGAFTGAFERKAGIFELSDGGTILLDEIGDMDIKLQAKLLQVLQDQEFRRIGGKETVRVNVRVIAATHRDLEQAIADRAFREDLYYRLNVVVLHVPALRERTEDIVALAEFLMRKHASATGPLPIIGVELRQAMLAYHWPGNVRELENCMRKLLIFTNSNEIARDLRARSIRKPGVAPVRPAENQVIPIERRADVPILEQVTMARQQAEIDAILSALDRTRWNRKQAASILKIDYKSLLYKMKKLGIDDGSSALIRESDSKRTASGD